MTEFNLMASLHTVPELDFDQTEVTSSRSHQPLIFLFLNLEILQQSRVSLTNQKCGQNTGSNHKSFLFEGKSPLMNFSISDQSITGECISERDLTL